ncbi:unnamed protein product [Alopecurus aequalis]
MMTMDCNYTTKTTKAEVAAGEGCGCANRRKVEEPASQGEKTANGPEAPGKGMLRIPQAKIDWILSRRKRRAPRIHVFKALDADAEFMKMIHDMAQAREKHWANMCKLQEWVRGEYAAKGYVEVDEDSAELTALPPPDVAGIEEADYEDQETSQFQKSPVHMIMDP